MDPASMQNHNSKFFVLWAWQKWQNLVHFADWKVCILRSTHLPFCVAQNIKYFKFRFYTFVGYTHWHLVFFLRFLRTCKYYFVFLNKEITGARSQKSPLLNGDPCLGSILIIWDAHAHFRFFQVLWKAGSITVYLKRNFA